MNPKTQKENEVFQQMIAMLNDQFSHQTGNNITINRMELADMLTKQTIHGMTLHEQTLNEKDIY